MTGPQPLQVSVVVPTYRRPDLLERCLNALCAQTLAHESYEIIVCDDGPTDDNLALVARFIQRGCVNIQYVPVTETQGPAGARNRGWQAANAAIVAFTDDDTVPDARWLEEGLRAFEPGVAAVTGGVVMPISDPPTDYERNESGLTTAEFVTANCFVARWALEEVGGFDERFRMAWREDSDLHFALLSRGHRIVSAPQARVVHPVRPAPPGISLRQQRKVVFDALLYKKWPTLYRKRIRPRPPWNYFAIVASLIVAAVAAIAGAWTVAGVALAVWAALTLEFFLRRLRGTSRAAGHVLEMLVTSILIPPVSVYWRLVGALRFKAGFL